MGSAQRVKATIARGWQLLALSLSMWALGACGTLSTSPVIATASTTASGCELDGSRGGEVIILPGEAGAPEVATGYAAKSPRYAKTYMAISNPPMSTKGACEILKRGGTAGDAAMAARPLAIISTESGTELQKPLKCPASFSSIRIANSRSSS